MTRTEYLETFARFQELQSAQAQSDARRARYARYAVIARQISELSADLDERFDAQYAANSVAEQIEWADDNEKRFFCGGARTIPVWRDIGPMQEALNA